MKRLKELLEHRWFAYTFAMCTAVVLYLFITRFPVIWSGLGYFYSMLRPVVIGLVIAYVLNPLVKLYDHTLFSKLTKPTLSRSLSVLVAIATVILLIVVLMIALVPQLIDSVRTLVGNLDNYAAGLSRLLNDLNERVPMIDISELARRGTEFIESIPDRLPSEPGAIFSTTWSIGAGFLTGALGFILAIYFLIDKVRLQSSFKRLAKACLSDRHYEDFGKFWSRCNTILLRFIGGDILDSTIVGIVNFVFMLFMGMPYAILISVVVGVTNLAPTFGPILGGAIGAFILILANPWHVLWFLIFTVVLQLIDGYVVKPKLFGDTFGIPSVWILISLIVFGRMFGVAGIMLAIPFTAIISYCYDEILIHRLEARKKSGKQK